MKLSPITQFLRKTLIWILIGIALNLQINSEKTDICTIQALPIWKHDQHYILTLLLCPSVVCIYLPLNPAFYFIALLVIFVHYTKSITLWTIAISSIKSSAPQLHHSYQSGICYLPVQFHHLVAKLAMSVFTGSFHRITRSWENGISTVREGKFQLFFLLRFLVQFSISS